MSIQTDSNSSYTAPGIDGMVEDWSADKQAFDVPWGKLMMWIFLLSDTFIFSIFLTGYMNVRLSQTDNWPNPSEVFALSLGGAPIPLILIAIMTFVLISSSGTMRSLLTIVDKATLATITMPVAADSPPMYAAIASHSCPCASGNAST